jgi:hypothetical protein
MSQKQERVDVALRASQDLAAQPPCFEVPSSPSFMTSWTESATTSLTRSAVCGRRAIVEARSHRSFRQKTDAPEGGAFALFDLDQFFEVSVAMWFEFLRLKFGKADGSWQQFVGRVHPADGSLASLSRISSRGHRQRPAATLDVRRKRQETLGAFKLALRRWRSKARATGPVLSDRVHQAGERSCGNTKAPGNTLLAAFVATAF